MLFTYDNRWSSVSRQKYTKTITKGEALLSAYNYTRSPIYLINLILNFVIVAPEGMHINSSSHAVIRVYVANSSQKELS